MLLVTLAAPATANEPPGQTDHQGTATNPDPHISLSVATGLTDNETITVTGTGFCRQGSCPDTIGVEMCVTPVQGEHSCDQSQVLATGQAPSGTFTLQVHVKQHITVGPTGNTPVTCAADGNCAVGVSNFAAPHQLPAADEAVGFGGTPATATTRPAAPTHRAASSPTPAAHTTPPRTIAPTAATQPTAQTAVTVRPATADSPLSVGVQVGIGLGALAVVALGFLGGYLGTGWLRRRRGGRA